MRTNSKATTSTCLFILDFEVTETDASCLAKIRLYILFCQIKTLLRMLLFIHIKVLKLYFELRLQGSDIFCDETFNEIQLKF